LSQLAATACPALIAVAAPRYRRYRDFLGTAVAMAIWNGRMPAMNNQNFTVKDLLPVLISMGVIALIGLAGVLLSK
jgi:hypothetical protein